MHYELLISVCTRCPPALVNSPLVTPPGLREGEGGGEGHVQRHREGARLLAVMGGGHKWWLPLVEREIFLVPAKRNLKKLSIPELNICFRDYSILF